MPRPKGSRGRRPKSLCKLEMDSQNSSDFSTMEAVVEILVLEDNDESVAEIELTDGFFIIDSEKNGDEPGAGPAEFVQRYSIIESEEKDENHDFGILKHFHPRTVTWLLENYEEAEGVNLPRSTIYNHYILHCKENEFKAVNPASFGKLMRKVFYGLKTRRLGTRGNSKYHYDGITIKKDSELNNIYFKEEDTLKAPEIRTRNSIGRTLANKFMDNRRKTGLESPEELFAYLGNRGDPLVFEETNMKGLPGQMTDIIKDFEKAYLIHCEKILDHIIKLDMENVMIEMLIFWGKKIKKEEEDNFIKDQVNTVTSIPQVQVFVERADLIFHQKVIDVLIPDPLKSIPEIMNQAIRFIGSEYEVIVTKCIAGMSDKFIAIKSLSTRNLTEALISRTKMNLVSNTVRTAILSKKEINNMVCELNHINFDSRLKFVSLSTEVNQEHITLWNEFVASFKQLVYNKSPLDSWLEKIKYLEEKYLGEKLVHTENFKEEVWKFIHNWSFFISQLNQEFITKSPHFSTFIVICDFIQQYFIFLAEIRLGKYLGYPSYCAFSYTPLKIETEEN